MNFLSIAYKKSLGNAAIAYTHKLRRRPHTITENTLTIA